MPTVSITAREIGDRQDQECSRLVQRKGFWPSRNRIHESVARLVTTSATESRARSRDGATTRSGRNGYAMNASETPLRPTSVASSAPSSRLSARRPSAMSCAAVDWRSLGPLEDPGPSTLPTVRVKQGATWPARYRPKRTLRDATRTMGDAQSTRCETSPYLLQHAQNPVDWFPWGPDALARAKLLDRPIFLSIGYAACLVPT